MCLLKISVMCFAVLSAAGSIIRHNMGITTICKDSDFRCTNGTCINADLVCNNFHDCPDGADEAFCYTELEPYEMALKAFLRQKRQTKCRKSEFQCLDESCIPFYEQCDGKYNCEDKSDETHALCRNRKCHSNLFTCTYGACVDGDAACNGIDDCVDRSDELLPRCKNETSANEDQFTCLDGTKIPSSDLCDGVVNCPDGSDEVIESCASMKCRSHLFRCAYGACVDQNADCNGINDCADGSDESEVLCYNQVSTRFGAPKTCKLPPQPDHGTYEVSRALSALLITVTCNPGYAVVGDNKTYCNDGNWSRREIKSICVRHCTLPRHDSVNYSCLVRDHIQGTRICNDQEPDGTKVKVECKRNYFSRDAPLTMTCYDGEWNRIIKCIPECGRLTPKVDNLSIGGRTSLKGEISWHAGIYRINGSDYMQICGGSIISPNFIISAAHCFWDERAKKIESHDLFAVAVAKYYRDWNHNKETDAQKFYVESIIVPEIYESNFGNNDRDIALVKLKTSIVYTNYVRPICLSFDENFQQKQLQPTNRGKVAGWGYVSAEGKTQQALKVVDLPYVPIEQCRKATPDDFRNILGTDKICAGFNNGTATLCKGDSGGSLAFPEMELDGVQRFYLRGIASSAPQDTSQCNRNAVVAFTDISLYKQFIRNYIKYEDVAG